MQVAVDGPAGSGKSTVCKILAKRYGMIYLDTGAMYRAAAWFSKEFTDENLGAKLEDVDFIFSDNGRSLALKIDGKVYDVTKEIRTPIISQMVSKVAANPATRAVLTKKQQEYAAAGDVIMEGRDITTAVLPKAEIKVYLTATAEERARRRFLEWKSKDDCPPYEEVLESIKRRDEADSSRACSPLTKSADASLVDTTGLSLEDVAMAIGSMIEAKRR